MCLAYGLALTMHLGMEGDYNDIHPFIECQYNNIVTNAYYNSMEKTTLYLGYRKQYDNGWGWDLGLATGYNESVVPTGRITYNNLFILPGVEWYDDDYQVGVVIGMEIKLGK